MELLFVSHKVSKTKNNQPYVQVETVDCDGKFKTLNIWGCKTLNTPIMAVVSVSDISDSNGFYSCSFNDVKLYKEIKDDYLKFLPKQVTQSEYYDLYKNCFELCNNSVEQGFITFIFPVLFDLYKDKTAARSNHHAFKGGLLKHTTELLQMFVSIYPSLPFKVDPFVVIVSCLFHDFGKVSEYTSDYDYTDDFFLKGHPFISAESAGKILTSKGIDPHTIDHIQHCILSHHGRLEYGAPVVPCTTEAFLVSKLDELSGHGVMFEKVGSKVNGTYILSYN